MTLTDKQIDAINAKFDKSEIKPKRQWCVCGWRFTCSNCKKQGLTWEQTEGRNR